MEHYKHLTKHVGACLESSKLATKKKFFWTNPWFIKIYTVM